MPPSPDILECVNHLSVCFTFLGWGTGGSQAELIVPGGSQDEKLLFFFGLDGWEARNRRTWGEALSEVPMLW